MNRPQPPMRMAIAQQAMYWTTAENAACIVASLAVAAEQGACVCVFPELALTGFHRGLREQADPAIVAQALRQVQAACRTHQIACALGAPTFVDDGAILNSYLLVNDQGDIIAETAKDGLTPAEATFFARGTTRSVVQFAGRACATVICREVEDLEPIAAKLADDTVDLVFWPGLVSAVEGAVDPLAYGTEVSALARRLGAYVVQSNWPQALNKPEATQLGLSRVVGADGIMVLQLPADQAGIGVFNLGERAYHWTPLPASHRTGHVRHSWTATPSC